MTTSPNTPPRKVIVEDDVSGFHAAYPFLLQSPEAEVLGFSAISGNVWRDQSLAWVRRMLEITGRPDVPALPGSVFPLLNSEVATERWEALYGKLVWKGAWSRGWVEETLQNDPRHHAHDVVLDLPIGNPSTVKARDEHAALAMLRLTREFPGEITIIATGPLTTLALAQSLDPGFAGRVKELVYMGGSLNPHRRRDSASAHQFAREFANSPRREFNIRWDPEAARIVMRSPWPRITMVPVDPSTATELTPELLARMTAADTPLCRALASRRPGFPLWDEIAVAVWLRPELITESEELYIDINVEFGPGYGDVMSWAPGYQPGLGESLQTVVRSIDVDAFEGFLVERLTAPQPPAVGVDVPARDR
jgi:inosine-uridine nucleoside N-ribohydrolase